MWPNPFLCQNKLTFFNVKKVAEKIWATSVIFKKTPKVNNRPIGENSPNLVTLARGGGVC
jgi:hypothetical protein